jgi:hypothetical protein
MARLTTKDIVPGLRFEQRAGAVWTVVRIITYADKTSPHVQLVMERDKTTLKTISISALLEPRLFRKLD